jgi:hypothetical protein
MRDEIEIQSILVSRPTAVDEPGAAWTVLVLAVNHSASKTFHLWRSLRRVVYDPGSRHLRIDLADIESQDGYPPIHPRTPEQLELPPGGDVSLVVRVPTVISRIRAKSSSLGNVVEEIPVGPVEGVECNLAYSEDPIVPTAGMAPQAIRTVLQVGTAVAHADLPVTEA